MSWIRIDDHFAFHRKVIIAGNTAVGCWIRCMAQCGAYATKGFVAEEIARSIGSPKDLAALTRAGLWSPVKAGDVHRITGRRDTGRRPLPDAEVTMPGDGYFIRDFLHYQRQEDDTVAGATEAPAGKPKAPPPQREHGQDGRSPARPPDAQVRAQVCSKRAESESANDAHLCSLTRPDQTKTDQPEPANPTRPDQTSATRAPEARDSGEVAVPPEGDPDPEAEEDRARAVLARLTDIGWRSKLRRGSPSGWERQVRKIVREQGLTVADVDATLEFARFKAVGKGDPMDLVGKWIDDKRPQWKDVLADLADAKKHGKLMARSRAAQREADRDQHSPKVNGEPKGNRDAVDRVLDQCGPVFGEPQTTKKP